MSNYIVSTCGTSLLTNTADSESRKKLNELANKLENDLLPEGKRLIDDEAKKVREQLLQCNDFVALQKKSAEINTLLKLYDNQFSIGKNDRHLLLHTDTYEGQITAEILCGWLQSQGISQVEIHCCENLNTANAASFQQGIAKLAKYLAETLPGWRENRCKIIFQLSGGFKTLAGFMQTAGMFFADEIVYIFETSDALLRIPRIPVQLDNVVYEFVESNLALFRLFERKEILTEKDTATLPSGLDLFIEKDGNCVSLTAWGELCWKQVKVQLYSKELLPSSDEQIKYSRKFENDCSKECTVPNHWKQVNERIDDFAKFVDSGMKTKLARLDFKEVRGNKMAPSTKEIDAWADGQAHRIFLHEENGIWIFDHLAAGLH
jgi:putative CRISPR-associated protein (TIGR02619 family)